MECVDNDQVGRHCGLSPLRYPGGKAKISPFIRRVMENNDLAGGHYAEPYAGGAGIAFSLLLHGYVKQVHLNDIDPAVYAFWRSVLDEPEKLCRLIKNTRVSISQWRRQRAIQNAPGEHSPLELGFSTFFLNRTNRSGIIKGGGVIGGLEQKGEWKLNARYYKETLIKRIEWIASQATRITLHCLDAEKFMRDVVSSYSNKMLVYLDPPYYVKGHKLYEHHYKESDHSRVASLIQNELLGSWLVSYDDHEEIRRFYRLRRCKRYGVEYTAAARSIGREVMFFSDDLLIPKMNPC
jgi:DNA adenine methylase